METNTGIINARLTKNIQCPALGFSILKGSPFQITHIGQHYSSCQNLGITEVWNDEYEIIPSPTYANLADFI